MRRADSQPPFDADANMQGRQDSTLTGDGSCTLAAASADQISQLDRQLPALNGNGPTVSCYRDTKWRHLKDDRDAAARELVALSLIRLESANLQLPPYVAGMPDPNWILQLKGAKEWDCIGGREE